MQKSESEHNVDCGCERHPLQTRPSLLRRLSAGGKNEDWEVFYDQYRRVILSFCRGQGLDENDAKDVLQETALLLMRKIPSFRYDPVKGKFRNWLLKLVAGKVGDARKRARRAGRTEGIDEHEPFLADPAGEEPSAGADRVWRLALMEEAFRRMEKDPKTSPDTLRVFEEHVLHGASVAEVADRFDIEQNAVYQIKSRILKRLCAMVTDLEQTPF